MLHEDPAHGLCGDGQKVGPVLPLHLLVVDQPEVSLVDQGGCLKGIQELRQREKSAVGAATRLIVCTRLSGFFLPAYSAVSSIGENRTENPSPRKELF
jgi:hypothetical protein